MLPETYRFVMTTQDGVAVDAGPLVSSEVTLRLRELEDRQVMEHESEDMLAAMEACGSGPWSRSYRDQRRGIEQAVWDVFGPDEMWRFMSHCDAVWDALVRGDVPDACTGGAL